jgi:circadian clock protein KaiB
VAGATVRSRQAILDVRKLCAAEPAGRCSLEVIDIYQQPGLARENQIVATPTLLRELPRPARRFIGDAVNGGWVVAGLSPRVDGGAAAA